MGLTTFEMDGLFNQTDIDNRFYIMGQCKDCGEWTKIDTRVKKPFTCTYCNHNKYDMRGARSIRSWLITKDVKTKYTRKKR